MRPIAIAVAAVAALLVLPAAAGADSHAAARAATAVLPTPNNDLHLSAAHPIPTEVAGQPGPIRIDGCYSDGRGTDGLTLVHHALRLVNTGDRAVSAVRVRFAFYDAFGDVNATRTNIAQTRLEPGQTLDKINLAELSDAGPPAKITCSVDAVRYDDGTLARATP
ncbi:MAG: hypothetical protein JO103_03815 [Candidatus Eremiobacteraeota bacterium]|nr:hypothetical protein [Candidatus Eremiobacteraeota bacterium]